MNPRSAALAALTAGLMVGCSAAVGSAAHADTSGEGGILSGNQVIAPINAPVNLSGNAVAVLGTATASAQGQTVIEQPEPPELTTSGKGGILSGNQIFAPVTVPITACGNAVSILGSAAAGCEYKVVIKAPKSPKKKPHHHHGPSTSGEGGILSGNQIFAPVDVPITACGNAVALLGQAEADCHVLVKTGEGGSGHGHDHGGSEGDHHGGGSGGGHHGGGSGNGHHGGGSGGGHHGGESEGGHHGGGSGGGHNGGSSGGGHHGGGSGSSHHSSGSGGGHHAAGSGTGGKHNGSNPSGSGSHETGNAAAAPAPHSTGHAHKKGGLPLTGVPTELLASLGASVLVAGAILVAVGRRRRTGAAEGGASMS